MTKKSLTVQADDKTIALTKKTVNKDSAATGARKSVKKTASPKTAGTVRKGK